MVKIFLKILFRNFIKNKTFTLINISGLTAGLLCCTFIFLFVFDEYNFDRHFAQGEDIYRLTTEVKGAINTSTSMSALPWSARIKQSLPEVEQSTRLFKLPGTDQHLFKLMEQGVIKTSFFERNGFLVDSTFFSVFSYPFIHGDPKEALKQPFSLVLSAELSAKYFGSTNPIGRTIQIENPWGIYPCFVTGVFKHNTRSHIPAEFFISMYSGEAGDWVRHNEMVYGNDVVGTYIKVNPGTDPRILSNKFPALLASAPGLNKAESGLTRILGLERLTDIHLLPSQDFDLSPRGNSKQLWVLLIIGIFILLIACINYMNLTAGGFIRRLREVGVRKLLGARRTDLMVQFLAESILICLVAFTCTLLLSMPVLPLFQKFTNKVVDVHSFYLALFSMFGVSIAAGLVAGFIPALYLASFHAIDAVKKKFSYTLLDKLAVGKISLIKAMVVLQFTVATSLIIGMLVIWRQMQYLQNSDLGFNQEQKLILPLKTTETETNYPQLKFGLGQLTGVTRVSACTAYPGILSFANLTLTPAGTAINEPVQMNVNYTDDGFLQLMDIGLKAGRYPSSSYSSDTAAFGAWVLNESAVSALGFTAEEVIGKKFNAIRRNQNMEFEVIGVLKDYHFESLHKKISPQGFRITRVDQTGFGYAIAEVSPGNWSENLDQIKKVWQSVNPEVPFEYRFLDEAFKQNYDSETKMLNIVVLFAILGICISCIGLFGLAMQTMESRSKEISIRKILGANLKLLIILLSTDFVKLVLIAVIVATPIAWWTMNIWLKSFAYRITMDGWVFIAAGIIALSIAMLTISYHAIRIAISNPINALRAE